MEEKKYKLIIWDEDWADEFDIFGFDIIELSNFNNLLNIIEETDKDSLAEALNGEYYFGTNESMEYEYDDIINTLSSAQTISKSEYDVLCKLFSISIDTNMVDYRGQSFLETIIERLGENNILHIKHEISIEKGEE